MLSVGQIWCNIIETIRQWSPLNIHLVLADGSQKAPEQLLIEPFHCQKSPFKIEKAAHLIQGKGGNYRPVFLKPRRNVPPFLKAASEVGLNMWRDVKLKVGLWTVT